MRIAHISDTHIGVPAPARADREGDLARTLEALCAMDPAPDVVIHTGDAANNGRPEEYARLRSIMAALPMPWFVVPGNRDVPHHMREALRATSPTGSGLPPDVDEHGPLHYAVDLDGLRLVAFDSTTPAGNKGRADAARLAALERRLAAADRPVVVIMHHPPFAIPGARDPLQYVVAQEATALRDAIARHPHVLLVATGHSHRFATGRAGHAPVVTIPSTATDLRKGVGEGQVGRAPAWVVHDVDPIAGRVETRLCTAGDGSLRRRVGSAA